MTMLPATAIDSPRRSELSPRGFGVHLVGTSVLEPSKRPERHRALLRHSTRKQKRAPTVAVTLKKWPKSDTPPDYVSKPRSRPDLSPRISAGGMIYLYREWMPGIATLVGEHVALTAELIAVLEARLRPGEALIATSCYHRFRDEEYSGRPERIGYARLHTALNNAIWVIRKGSIVTVRQPHYPPQEGWYNGRWICTIGYTPPHTRLRFPIIEPDQVAKLVRSGTIVRRTPKPMSGW